tara:strand:- start:484 stop:636 length:153 start_codon:yes stop_codon:yes gene_type:complete
VLAADIEPSMTLAIPKSPSFTRFFVMKMFCVLRSRCRMRLECTWCSAITS